jgi:hypothetical protein
VWVEPYPAERLEDGYVAPDAHLRGSQIADVTAFIARSSVQRAQDELDEFPDQPADERLVTAFFERFGLPPRL